MNKKEHLGGAIIILIVIYFILEYLQLENYLGYAVAIFLGVILPDLIEPAFDYNHRRFFHSKKTLRFLSTWGLGISFILGVFINEILYIFFGIIGYVLHLVQDSTTKMGLPN